MLLSGTKLDSGGLIVNAVNSDGATPLHLAADGGKELVGCDSSVGSQEVSYR